MRRPPVAATPFDCHAQLEKQGTINNELAVVISSTALACKQIANLVNRAGISNLTGVAGATNVQVRRHPCEAEGREGGGEA